MSKRHSQLVMITGVPGSGKTSSSEALAEALEPVARVFTDEIRHRVSPYEFPWVEPEGRRQHLLGINSACKVAEIYLKGGFNVVMNDVLVPHNYAEYRAFIERVGGTTVLLRPPVEVALARNKAREKDVPEDLISDLHESFQLQDFNVVINNSNLTPIEVAKEIKRKLGQV